MSREGPPYDRYGGGRDGGGYGGPPRWAPSGPSRDPGPPPPPHGADPHHDPRMARYEQDRQREREWARYDRERYERRMYERGRGYGGADPHAGRAGPPMGHDRWDGGREREEERRRWADARDYRPPPRHPDDSYGEPIRGGGPRYERDVRDRGFVERYPNSDAAAAAATADVPAVAAERDPYHRPRSGTWRRNPSPYRSRSPRSASRRSSPSMGPRRTSPSPAMAADLTALPYDSVDSPRLPRRDSQSAAIDDREASVSSHAQAPPVGPRRSFARPPPSSAPAASRPAPLGPRGAPDETPTPFRTPSRTYDRSPFASQTPNTPGLAPPLTPSSSSGGVAGGSGMAPSGPRREGMQRDTSHLHIPLRSPAHGHGPGSISGASNPATPAIAPPNDGHWTPAGRKPSYAETDIRGSIDPRAEAEIFSLSLDRIRFQRSLVHHPALVATRKAMQEVADAEMELAGARLRSAITETALQKAREEAEAWGIETTRIELEQHKTGPAGYWQVTTTAAIEAARQSPSLPMTTLAPSS